ncbi:fumarylacetoacetate hydrolase family protein [Rhizobiaceae bacterium n13]|uniref:Fumarylacetoacetate hydrolase family protein n=1 Tax=Ferirhizobium litorale TaxID=2927786 RepID=A0AAE3U2Q9_9HYPH|nr:fumarylacetoacetate hydrolase family protein [Fererhizobium litorale]MDI7862752.1 fumarylacetoacetate hydrolase family protein [Fererhizobium litorale]MDI7924384.1 fumarylacetoacetate hydrolase family protein [Fererhizobium litorale]
MNDMSQLKNYVFKPAPTPTVPIAGSEAVFPVHRIYCVGRNFADHAIEMGHDPNKEPPFFFQKNPDTLVLPGADFPYPSETQDVHHEIEMVVALHKGGTNIPLEKALDCVFGYGVGLDMTRRDLQGEAKKLGRPWETGKAFEASAPCSVLHPVSEVGHPTEGSVWLKVNGEIRQSGDLNQMIWKVPEMIAYLSRLFELKAGDLIFAGTPAGVGAVVKGDEMIGHVAGVDEIRVRVA